MLRRVLLPVVVALLLAALLMLTLSRPGHA
jgi:hypothetical protein